MNNYHRIRKGGKGVCGWLGRYGKRTKNGKVGRGIVRKDYPMRSIRLNRRETVVVFE